MKTISILAGVSALAVMLPSGATAQTSQPVKIEDAHYGTVHVVVGDDLPVAVPRANCPAQWQLEPGGPCFQSVALKPAAQGETRVLGLQKAVSEGARVSGSYGYEYALYQLFPTAEGAQIRRVELATSEIRVPGDCYALRGEGITYTIKGGRAEESQLVSCGGGPYEAQAPYRIDGPVILSADNGWHKTEMMRVEGGVRYLATPGGGCDPQYSIRNTWCAQPAVTYLQTHPDVKELDLIAAKRPVEAGDIIDKDDIDQWVLKRKGAKKFKADGRWVDKSFMGDVNGCTPTEGIRWWVMGYEDGLYIVEKAMNRCGAPLAPVPTEIWEAYGDDYYIVDCGERRDWRKGRPRPNGADGKSPGDQASECFDGVGDYLRRNGRSSTTVVVINERARVDDRLYNGSYVSYDVAEVSINPDKTLYARRLDYFEPTGVYMNRCSNYEGGPAESKGFVIVRSMGISWARAYRWMSCPVY